LFESDCIEMARGISVTYYLVSTFSQTYLLSEE